MNELKHKAEFRSVLKDYKPSQKAHEVLEGMTLVLLTGPTACGRNTIINHLVKTGQYQFIVSDTTREKRINKGVPEQDGVEYWFRSETDFLADLQQGLYLEAELIHEQQVSGISIRELEKAKVLHKIAIDEVDIQGISNVLPAKPDTIGIIIIPPHFEEWMQRVNGRGHMHEEEQRRRFNTAANMFAMAKAGTYPVIVNDVLVDAVHKVDVLAKTGELMEDQVAARKVAETLYADTQKYLKQLA